MIDTAVPDRPAPSTRASAGRTAGAGAAAWRAGLRLALYPVVPLAFLGFWYVLGRLGALPPGIIPQPQAVLRGWWYWVFGNPAAKMMDAYSGTWLATVVYSARRVLEGYAIGLCVGAPLGIVVGWSNLAARLIDPSIQAVRPIPITAWIPFAIAWFGIEDANAIFLVSLSAFFPIFISSTHGARDINKNLVRAARMMGASDRQLLLRVILPNALPSVFTGMRLGVGYAWTVLVVAEMISVKAGVGYVLWDAYYIARMEIVVADMITVGLLGFLSDRLIVLLQARLLGWKRLHSE
ncbi:MAG TPA: ABC transporter permease [Candidatus Sulfotelmatobacter sp.]|nr:ABC transporter permease [Candidatus Sulfotelmatobacter sp.]